MDGVNNYWRFYAGLNRMGAGVDREELKRSLVWQYTNGRTEHLHEMTREEYTRCCDRLDELSGYRSELRKRRSVCLRLMQRLGVNTYDWSRVDALCEDRRIAGKRFSWLSVEELGALERKLRAIDRAGGFRRRGASEASPASSPEVSVSYVVDLSRAGEC